MTFGSLPKSLRIRFFSVNEYAICVPQLLTYHPVVIFLYETSHTETTKGWQPLSCQPAPFRTIVERHSANALT